MRRTHIIAKTFTTSLALIYLASNGLLLHSAETNFWKERRANRLYSTTPSADRQLYASLPMGFSLPASAPVLLSQINPANAPIYKKRQGETPIAKIIKSLPVHYGTVRSVRVPKNADGRLAVYIQDIHLNSEAQANIGNTVATLSAGTDLKMLGLEGAFDQISLDRFHRYSDQETIRKTADYLLKRNDISGPVHAMMVSQNSHLPIIGVDSPIHHKANADAYRQSLKALGRVKKTLERQFAELEMNKKLKFSPSLLDFDAQVTAFRNGHLSLSSYLQLLSGRSEFLSTNVELFVEALKTETSLNFSLVESERNALLSHLIPALGKQKIDYLVNLSVSFKMGQVSNGHFYSELKEICAQHSLTLSDYPALKSYVQYVLMSEAIDAEKLFKDVRIMETQVYEGLIKNTEEKQIVAKGWELYLTGKLIDFSLTRDEWNEYKAFKPSPPLKSFAAFYKEAEIRDLEMANNFIRQGKSPGILVAGGFHSAGVTDRLLKSGITVVNFVPRLTQVEGHSGVAALGIFAQEKTPLEQIFNGEKLFLAQNPAKLFVAPFAAAAIGIHRDAKHNVQETVSNLLPSGSLVPTVEASISGDVVSQQLTFEQAGQPQKTIESSFTLNPEHEIVSAKEAIKHSYGPELLTGAILAFLGVTGSIGFSFPMWAAVFIMGSIVTRFMWMTAIFIHGSGHMMGRLLLDNQTKMNLKDIFEGTTLKEFVSSLVPFSAIYTPGLVDAKSLPAGDTSPNKIRVKAILGIAFNLIAMGTPFFFGMGSPDNALGMVAFVSFITTNALFALTSLSDVDAFVTGSATRFSCGLFVMIGMRITADGKNLLPERFRNKIRVQGVHTQGRGRQAGGGLVVGVSPENTTHFIGRKGVNAKRGDLTQRVLGWLDTKVKRAEKKGFQAPGFFLSFFHWRFGTSSAPSELETHYHGWVPEHEVKLWRFNADGVLAHTKETLDLKITHNGDMDGFLENVFLKVFGKKVDVGQIGETMRRFLWPNETKGDSPKIAGVMTLLHTQGMWDASVRLAYLLTIADSFESIIGLVRDRGMESIKVGEGNEKSVVKRPISVAQDIQAMMEQWAERFEVVFEKHKHKLFKEGATSFSEIEKAAVPPFIDDLVRSMDGNLSMSKWPKQKQKEFAEVAFYTFLNNDLENALKMFSVTPQTTSSFGLGVVTTLVPGQIMMMAKGQPLTIGYSPRHKTFVSASEPAAVVAALADDPDGKMFDLNDETGEIAKLTPTNVQIYSQLQFRGLTDVEIQKRWIPIQNNQYIQIPANPVEGEDLVRQDIHDIVGVMEKIEADFSDPDSWNSLTTKNITNDLIEKIRANGHGKNPEEVDIALVAEEKSKQVAYRFANDLRSIFPTLKICVISGNRYLKNQEKLYKNGIIGSNTIMMAISQSGQTYPTLKSARHGLRQVEEVTYETLRAEENIGGEPEGEGLTEDDVVAMVKSAERSKAKGRLKSVYVMTGEWYTKMGKAVGQEFFPDSQFTGRIFSNQSGRRRSEASTVATVAADYSLTKILIRIGQAVKTTFPEGSPYKTTMSLEAIGRLEVESQRLVKEIMPQLTGQDESSPVYQNLVRMGRQWADHVMEPLIVTLFMVVFTFVTVTFGWLPFSVLANIAFNTTGVIIPSTVVSLLNATLYAFLYWGTTYSLRWLQGRTILARTGTRSIVIVSPMWKLLRNYVERLWGEGWGHLTPFVDGRKPEDLVNDKASAVVRGTLIFGQMDNLAPHAKGQRAEVSATKMATQQSDGIQNFGVGPETVLTHFDPSAKQKFQAIALRTEQQMTDLPASTLDPVAQELITSRFRYLEMLVSGQVFFWAMADKTARFDLNLYGSNKKGLTQTILRAFFKSVAMISSFSFIRIYSFLSQKILGTQKMTQLFALGATQSGTTIATTQMTPDQSSQTADGVYRDIPTISEQIQETAGGPESNIWVPSTLGNPIVNFLAHLYDISHFRNPPLSKKSYAPWNVYSENTEMTLVIPNDAVQITENPETRELTVLFNPEMKLRIIDTKKPLGNSTKGVKIPYKRSRGTHVLTTPSGEIIAFQAEHGFRLHISGDYKFQRGYNGSSEVPVNNLLVLPKKSQAPPVVVKNEPNIQTPPSNPGGKIHRNGGYFLPILSLLFATGFVAAAITLNPSSSLMFGFFGTVVLPLVSLMLVWRTFAFVAGKSKVWNSVVQSIITVDRIVKRVPVLGQIHWLLAKLTVLFYEFGFQPIDRLIKITFGQSLDNLGAVERLYRWVPTKTLKLILLPFASLVVFVQKRVTLLVYYSAGLVILSVAVLAVLQWTMPGTALATFGQIISWNALSALGIDLTPVLGQSLALALNHVASPWAFASSFVLAALLIGSYRFTFFLRGKPAPKQSIGRSLIKTAFVLHMIPLEIALIKLLLVHVFGLEWLFEMVEGQNGVLGIGNRLFETFGINPLQWVPGFGGYSLAQVMALPQPEKVSEDKSSNPQTAPATDSDLSALKELAQIREQELEQVKNKLMVAKKEDAAQMEIFKQAQTKQESVLWGYSEELTAKETELSSVETEFEERRLAEENYSTELKQAQLDLEKAQIAYEDNLSNSNSGSNKARYDFLKKEVASLDAKLKQLEKYKRELPNMIRSSEKAMDRLSPWARATMAHDLAGRDATDRFLAKNASKSPTPFIAQLKEVGIAHAAGAVKTAPRTGDVYYQLKASDLSRVKPLGEYSEKQLRAAGARSDDKGHVILPVKPAKIPWHGIYKSNVSMNSTDLAIVNPQTGELLPVKLGAKGWDTYIEQRFKAFASTILKNSPEMAEAKRQGVDLTAKKKGLAAEVQLIEQRENKAKAELARLKSNLDKAKAQVVVTKANQPLSSAEAQAKAENVREQIEEIKQKQQSAHKTYQQLVPPSEKAPSLIKAVETKELELKEVQGQIKKQEENLRQTSSTNSRERKDVSPFLFGLFGGLFVTRQPPKNDNGDRVAEDFVTMLSLVQSGHVGDEPSNDTAKQLSRLLAGSPLSLSLSDDRFKINTASGRFEFLDAVKSRMEDPKFLALVGQKLQARQLHLDVKQARWMLETSVVEGVTDSFDQILLPGKAKPNSVLVLTLNKKKMPKDLKRYFDIIRRYNTDAEGRSIGKVVCLVDSSETLALVKPSAMHLPGIQISSKPGLFGRKDASKPRSLKMTVLEEGIRELAPHSNLSQVRIVTAPGTDRDFDGLGWSSPLRTSAVIFVNELLQAVEIERDVQQKLDAMAVALIQA